MKIKGKNKLKALNSLKSSENLIIEDIIPKSAFNNDEARKELDKIKEIEDTIDREKLVYKTRGNTYDFRKFRTIRNFGDDIYNGEITLEEADEDPSNLIDEIKNFNNKTRPKNYKKKNKKKKLLVLICINFILQEK